jgi:plasmid stabilization system protein ParE
LPAVARRLRLWWDDEALADLERAYRWSPQQARRVYQRMREMARAGWSTGRRTSSADPAERYVSVSPLGVFYRIDGPYLRVVRVVDGRQLTELP